MSQKSLFCFKHFMPFTETQQSLFTEFCKRTLYMFISFFFLRVCLGKELVGIADEFLFKSFWQKVCLRKRKVLLFNLFFAQSCTGMTFADTCMMWKSKLSKHLCTNSAMSYVGLSAVTADAGSIAFDDAYVVKHCCLFSKLPVNMQFRMLSCYA